MDDTCTGTPRGATPSPRLAKSLANLWGRDVLFDVVIVGSGYGASVAAAELAGRVKADGTEVTVCVLERGREYLPGEFPDRFGDLPAHLRQGHQNSGEVGGNAEGLIDTRLGDDVIALVANGLGGGSLINAGVMLEPALEDFDAGSPLHGLIEALRKEDRFEEARRRLGARLVRDGEWVDNTIERHQEHGGNLPTKTRSLKSLARLGDQFGLPPLTVSMDGGANGANVKLNACNLCGDCLTGCNRGAKDSLDTNLLQQARDQGAALYTGASVLSLRRSKRKDPHEAEPHWVLRVAHTSPVLQAKEVDSCSIHARLVILGAGTLGTTEILLRSRDDQHVFTDRLGEGFSCNGDNLAAVYGMPGATKGCANEDDPPGGRGVGPTITGSIRTPGARAFLVQEFSVPGPLKRLFEETVTTARTLHVMPTSDGSRHGHEPDDRPDPLAVDAEAMAKTLLVGVIGHDDARGALHLPRPLEPRDRPPQVGTLRIRWPEARHGAGLAEAQRALEDMATGTAPRDPPSVVANPVWRLLPDALEELIDQPRGPVFTVHPLGGCRIGERTPPATEPGWAGVVDDLGRVYDMGADRKGQPQWFGTLVALDGSIIPASLGVNPALTITATALRAVHHLAAAWGFLQADERMGPPPPPTPRRMLEHTVPPGPRQASTATSVDIVERLRGPMTLAFEDGPRDCIVELTLRYEPKPVAALIRTLGTTLQVVSDDKSRLRVFDADQWERLGLRFHADHDRNPWALFDARVTGTLALLQREPSTAIQRRWRSIIAWLLNRGLRDIYQRLRGIDRPNRAPTAPKGFWRSLWGRIQSGWGYAESLWRMSSRAGEVRRLDYDLAVESVLPLVNPGPVLPLGAGAAVAGHKRLTYGRRANPWKQLTQLTVTRMPGLVKGSPATLVLDGRFLASQGVPLLRVTRQQDQAVALAELTSLALYFARIILSTHLWTFRKPDTQPEREPRRLPETIPGIPSPEITELAVDRMPHGGKPVFVRLTRYAPKARAPGDTTSPPAPLVMIHGYSVSGNTFTHPSLSPSAAEYFWQQGRDVWVVDLRSSTGMPTAQHPWAMEQVGLVDIPAALLHIRNATQQRVDVFAHCIGCAMLGMAILSDAGEVRDGSLELGVDAWLTEAQLGTLAAFNGARPDGGPHPCIRSVVLSQKGPLLRYTDGNIFRAFLMQTLRRWLLPDSYSFQPSRRPGVTESLMDRLLASTPYPDDEYDIENPLWPCKLTPWVATRHRMDALYGRDFNAVNMAPETLAAIDDLFGPMSLDTVAQTIHFVRFNAITNQAGRGEFVTLGRLRERWRGIPTLAIHGLQNGLVDVSTQDLLTDHFKAAGVPFEALDSRKPPYRELGHQDVLIGTTSKAVFEDVAKFQKGPFSTPLHPVLTARIFQVPWSGPRLDVVLEQRGRRCRRRIRIACLSAPDQGAAELWLVPGVMHRNGKDVQCFCPSSQRRIRSPRGTSRDWLVATPPRLPPAESGADTPGWLAVIVSRWEDTTAVPLPSYGLRQRDPCRGRGVSTGAAATGSGSSRSAAAPMPPAGPVFRTSPIGWYHRQLERFRWGSRLLARWPAPRVASAPPHGQAVPAQAPPVGTSLEDWIESLDDSSLERMFVSDSDIRRARSRVEPKAPLPSFSFAVASCQYPASLIDQRPGGASVEAMVAGQGNGHAVDLVLLIGDQIYADATAGLVDPVRQDERYDVPNDRAMRVPALRRLMQRVPVRMLLDDHELNDNWEPLAPRVAHARSGDRALNRRRLRQGVRAWARFQRMSTVRVDKAEGAGDLDFRFGGYGFHFADTRTGRSARGSTTETSGPTILNARQWLSLDQFLCTDPDAVKFVATPSLLLPRRRATAEDPRAAARSDAWDGYPASLWALLKRMVDQQVTRTVFLSGDEHHALCSRIQVTCLATGKSIRIVSVHSSALYAPFPFANGRPDDLSPETTIECEGLCVDIRTVHPRRGDGHARVTVVSPPGGPAGLQVQFFRAEDPSDPECFEVPLG